MITETPRPIDHLVLPTGSLDLARKRLTALGFTVAPTGVHPFGTENCCVYFSDGTFLEPLALADDRVAQEAAKRGNVFTARDAAYRYRQGEEGFSALVFGSDDAAADHADFVVAGFSAGEMLEFSRDFVDAAGCKDTASFRLAFAADLRAPDAFFFTCQRINSPRIDRAALQAHANGVTGIKRIVLAAPDAVSLASVVLTASNVATAHVKDDGTTIQAANAAIDLLDPPAMDLHFGAQTSTDPGVQLRAVVFGVLDLDATEILLKSQKIAYNRRGPRLVIRPAPGQGAIFAFEAA